MWTTGPIKMYIQRGAGWLQKDQDALALNLAEFMGKKRHGMTGSPEDSKQYYCKDTPRLMKKVFS